MHQYEPFFVEIGLQIGSQEQKRLEPPSISEESAPIGLVSIIKVNKKTKIRHICFDIFCLSGRFGPLEFVHPRFVLEDPPQYIFHLSVKFFCA